MTSKLESWYRYLPDSGVHAIDCSGTVTLEIGTARLHQLALELASRPARGAHRKLLIDFRDTVWVGENVHWQLSVITRRDFGLHPENKDVRVAFLDRHRAGSVAENERWFQSESEALAWLNRAE